MLRITVFTHVQLKHILIFFSINLLGISVASAANSETDVSVAQLVLPVPALFATAEDYYSEGSSLVSRCCKNANPKKALPYLLKAANKEHAKAMLEIADLYADGLADMQPNPTKAITWYNKAKPYSRSSAYFGLARLYAQKNQPHTDLIKAQQFAKRAFADGHSHAGLLLASMAFESGQSKQMLAWLKKTVAAGHTQLSCCDKPYLSEKQVLDAYHSLQNNQQAYTHVLASMYAYDYELVGFKKDINKANKWFQNALNDKSNDSSEAILAYLDARRYQLQSLSSDEKLKSPVPIKELLASAAQKDDMGRLSHARLYHCDYDYIPKKECNNTVAWQQIKSIANQKIVNKAKAFAAHDVGLAYLYGLGVTANTSMAYQWFTKAAGLGVADSDYYLGAMYFFGIGIEKSDLKAREHFKTALDEHTQHDKVDPDIVVKLASLAALASKNDTTSLLETLAEIGNKNAMALLARHYAFLYTPDMMQKLKYEKLAESWYRRAMQAGKSGLTYDFLDLQQRMSETQAAIKETSQSKHNNTKHAEQESTPNDGYLIEAYKTAYENSLSKEEQLHLLPKIISASYLAKDDENELIKWIRHFIKAIDALNTENSEAENQDKSKQLGAYEVYILSISYGSTPGIKDSDLGDIARLFAQAGDTGAMYEIASDYSSKGFMTPAFRLFKQVAEKGNLAAMKALVEIYQHGLGVTANKSLAEKWQKKVLAADKKQEK